MPPEMSRRGCEFTRIIVDADAEEEEDEVAGFCAAEEDEVTGFCAAEEDEVADADRPDVDAVEAGLVFAVEVCTGF